MKTILKIAALCATICLIPAMLFGCRNEKKLTENFAVPKLGSENAQALSSGEIMVYENYKPEKEVTDRVMASVTETYIKFVQGSELSYDFTESRKTVSTNEIDLLEATQEGGDLTVARNGVVVSDDEAPDIFSYFKINYDVSDIENIDITDTGEGTVLYAVTMTSKYADKFDSEADGVKIDCTKVLYNYYIDASNVTHNVLSEFTSTVTCDGNSQQVVRFIQATIK